MPADREGRKMVGPEIHVACAHKSKAIGEMEQAADPEDFVHIESIVAREELLRPHHQAALMAEI